MKEREPLGDSLTTNMISDAMEQLAGTVYRTPLTTSTFLNDLAGKNVYFKMENQQKTGAFKIRGASYKMSRLTGKEAQKGVIAASAGNHAQGVAFAASKRGIAATIYMPENTPEAKIKATEYYGARTVITGASFQEAYEAALLEQKRTGSYFLHPFDDYDVMAGQATIAVEMLKQQPFLDTLIVPVGGGGLISGVAVAAKELQPKIRIIGVQAEGAKIVHDQFHNRPSSRFAGTIAEGIAVKEPGELTMPIIRHYVDDMVSVSDHDIANAIVCMLERKKTLVEGAGAAAFAALLTHRSTIRSKNCGIIVSGGNMDVSRLGYIQQLAYDGPMTCMA
ncbi:threonine ammonia-lyase [Bacillus sp. B-jedd]|uniref:threonine ammonia-lyase n=1 Tax=Bacillus sp. B-jedd TaxID=1476857 RepID=UPI0005155F60|nr:threonine ammonia-lyase [Bacillus sp. B-jedd]CEG25794.1 threonine dehydratase [Bacillus sp. B-jedd]